MKYKVRAEITKTIVLFDVEANSENDAENLVNKMYFSGKIDTEKPDDLTMMTVENDICVIEIQDADELDYIRTGDI